MANIKSAKKRILVTQRQTLENKMVRSDMRTVIKNARIAMNENSDDKDAKVKLAIKKIDKAVKKGIIHKNNAARKKSQLAKKLNQA